MKEFREILSILHLYRGTGMLLILYAGSLLYLALRERDRRVRTVVVWMPLLISVVFICPPFFRLYRRIEGAETYYRLLWLLPMAMTIIHAGLRLFRGHVMTGFVIICVAVVLCGQYTYANVNISRAENRLHLPQNVIDLCDYILSVSDGSRNVRVAMPAELVHFVRQYDTGIRMPFGREMLVERWGFVNPVYEAMETPGVIDAEKLAQAARDEGCSYIVLNAVRELDGELDDFGYDRQVLLDGYYVYRDPDVPWGD